MKILIGTPIHERKAYSIPRWLESVMETKGEWELLMVDNSDTDEFANDLRPLIPWATTVHIPECRGLGSEFRLIRAREYIRLRFLEGDYDEWFSWECDITAPPDGLQTLQHVMDDLGVMAVTSSYPDRKLKSMPMNGLGYALFKRPILEQFSFLEGGGTGFCDADHKECFYSGDGWLWRRIFRTGMPTIDLHNLVRLDHLSEVRDAIPNMDQS